MSGVSVRVSFKAGFVLQQWGSGRLIAVNKKRQLIEVEVKTSIPDLRADRKKDKHEYYRKLCGFPYKSRQRSFGRDYDMEPLVYPTTLFYFAVPKDMVNNVITICDELYPYAGVLIEHQTLYGNVKVARTPTILNKSKITLKQATILAKSQSATLVRMLEIIDNFGERLKEAKSNE